jgi:hypothetical protein
MPKYEIFTKILQFIADFTILYKEVKQRKQKSVISAR